MAEKTVQMTHPDLAESPEFTVGVESVSAWESRGWKQVKTKTKKSAPAKEKS